MKSIIPRLTLFAALVAASCVVQARQDPLHEHHDATAAAPLVSQLQLDGGKRWATDAALRSGMAQIRAAFDAEHPRIHAAQETNAQYATLAATIEVSVNGIVAQCKLPPAADAQLHFVIGDLLQGVALMRGSDPQRSRHDGAALVHGALRAYPKFFEDAAWRTESVPDAHAAPR
ncbi:MAG: hypothetical protein ACR2I8_08210 [Steroidobacteraceae bacterium]